MMRLEIPLVPPSPNRLRRDYRNIFKYKKLREQWEHDLFYFPPTTLRTTIRNFAMNHRMRVEISIYHAKPYDPDNLVGSVKPILDAMRQVGYIRDDSDAWMQLDPPKQFTPYTGHARKTIIDLEPIFSEKEAA